MAKKIKGPQIVIANRLTDGRVVFLGNPEVLDGQDVWTPDPAQAHVATTDAGIATLEAALATASDSNLVIDGQLIGASQADGATDGSTAPTHIKHLIQAQGPTVRTDLGYQVGPKWEG